MNNCIKCGTSITDDREICVKCAAQGGPTQTTEKELANQSPRALIIILVIGGIILGIWWLSTH